MKFQLLDILSPVFKRSASEMVLDIFAKEARVGKSELVADFLYAHLCRTEIVGDGSEGVFLYPFVGSLARIFLADDGQVFGRDA